MYVSNYFPYKALYILLHYLTGMLSNCSCTSLQSIRQITMNLIRFVFSHTYLICVCCYLIYFI